MPRKSHIEPDPSMTREDLIARSDRAWTSADLVTARHLLGWTQAQLAERIGYSRRAVVTLEAGGPLDPVMALAMQALLILPEPPVAIPATAPETAFDQGTAGEQP